MSAHRYPESLVRDGGDCIAWKCAKCGKWCHDTEDDGPCNPPRPPKRNRKSAKAAGSRFEREIADALAQYVDDRIDRRVKTGAKDRGDIAGVRLHGRRIVLELKNTARMDLAGWSREAADERANDDALAGLVISKRHGNGNPLDQWVHCTVRELIAILKAERIPEN